VVRYRDSLQLMRRSDNMEDQYPVVSYLFSFSPIWISLLSILEDIIEDMVQQITEYSTPVV
jgi:hypothetical protein